MGYTNEEPKNLFYSYLQHEISVSQLFGARKKLVYNYLDPEKSGLHLFEIDKNWLTSIKITTLLCHSYLESEKRLHIWSRKIVVTAI